MTVFVVTTGSYSDYSIRGLFSTRELAKEFALKLKEPEHEEGDVAEWQVDDPGQTVSEVRRYWVRSVDFVKGELMDTYYPAHEYRKIFPRNSPRGTTRLWDHGCGASCESCESQEHADKLAVEALQEWRAKRAIECQP